MRQFFVSDQPRRRPLSKLSAATLFFIAALRILCGSNAHGYEVAVGLGSTADYSATGAMVDRGSWPVVADLSWGPLANLYPIALLGRETQQAIFDNFRQRRAIAELPYSSIRWSGTQPDIDFIESFGLSVPYLFVLHEYSDRVKIEGQARADELKRAGVIDSMLSRDEIIRLKNRFPDKKIIMNSRSWTRDSGHIAAVQDVVDGLCIEFMPNNAPAYIIKDVAPYGVWAHENDKILMLLMPPLPDDHLEDRFVRVVTQAAQVIHDANAHLLPSGWMRSSKIIFVPANYSWTQSRLPYVPEDAKNSVLAAAKSLLLMRGRLDALPATRLPAAIPFLLQNGRNGE